MTAVSTATGPLRKRIAISVQPAAVDETQALVNVPSAGVDLDALERALIVFALDTTQGNRTRAARFLGLTRSALLYRLHKYGLVPEQGSSGL